MRPKTLLRLALLAWLAPFLIEGSVLLSSHIFYGGARDAHMWCNYRAFERYALLAGHLPLWNPYIVNGIPWQGYITNLLHPGTLLLWLCADMGLVFKISLWWSLGLACWGTSAWSLWRGSSPLASGLAGLIFAHGGYTISHLFAGHLDLIITLSWAPLFAWSMEAALRNKGWAFTVLATLCLGCQLASGHWPTCYLTVWCVGLLSLLNCWATPESVSRLGLRAWAGGESARLRFFWWALRWFLVVGLGLCLAAHQLVPLMDGAVWSNRPVGDPDYFTSFSQPPWAFLTYILPHLFDGSNNLGYWTHWLVWEGHDYLGLLGLALALVGATGRRRETLPMLAVIGMGWLIGLDGEARLLRLYAGWDPLVSAFRCPGRFLLAGHLLLPLLAARGLDLLLDEPERYRRWVSICLKGLGGLLLGLFLSLQYSDASAWNWLVTQIQPDGPHGITPNRLIVTEYWRVSLALAILLVQLAAIQRCHRGYLAWLPLVALALDLFCFAKPWLITAQPGRLAIPPGFSLPDDRGAARVEFGPRWRSHGGGLGWFEHGGYIPASGRAISLLWWGAQGPFVGLSGFRTTFQGPVPGIDRLQAVGYALITPDQQKGYPDWKVVLSSQDALLLEAPYKPQRLRLLGQVERCTAEQAVIRLARHPELGDTTALLEPGIPLPPLSTVNASYSDLQVEFNRVRFQTEGSSPFLAVLCDAWWPGWSARVNGQPVPLLSVNGGLHRGVCLSAGRHDVEMTFSPPGYGSACRLSVGVWVTLGFLFLASAWSLRTVSSQPRASSSLP